MKNNEPDTVQYVLGDLVVYRDFYIEFLLKIDMIIDEKTVGYRGASRQYMGFLGCTEIKEIRHATKAERKAKRRLLGDQNAI